MPTWFCWYMRLGSAGERTSRCTQKPTSSCGARPVGAQARGCAASSSSPPSSSRTRRCPARSSRSGSGRRPVGHDRRDAEMPGRLVRRVVPRLAPGLARERRQQRPALAAVARSRRCPAPRRRRAAARRSTASDDDLRHLARVVLAVGDALARVRPGLAEVVAAPDRRAVPLARGGRVDRAGRRRRGSRGRRASSRRTARARPVAAVVVALQHEQALSGFRSAAGPRHRRLTSGVEISRRLRPRRGPKLIGGRSTARP